MDHHLSAKWTFWQWLTTVGPQLLPVLQSSVVDVLWRNLAGRHCARQAGFTSLGCRSPAELGAVKNGRDERRGRLKVSCLNQRPTVRSVTGPRPSGLDLRRHRGGLLRLMTADGHHVCWAHRRHRLGTYRNYKRKQRPNTNDLRGISIAVDAELSTHVVFKKWLLLR